MSEDSRMLSVAGANRRGLEPGRRARPDTVATVTAHISAARTVDDDLVEAFARLVPQLSTTAAAPDREALTAIVGDPNTVLFLARVGERIVGSLTLAFYRIPTGLKSWIEDVVVDGAARGHGIATDLTTAALAEARRRGAKDAALTSRPSRTAANRLYQHLGFDRRETNVYRMELGTD